VVARWGGEEFAIGLYGLNREQGVMRIVKLLEIIHQQDLTDANNQIFHISFSAGVAEYPQNGENLESLYRSADAALYQAKVTGRNRVLPAQSGD
jgi:diguanylate cyclase (GGDEF)-like protein